MSEVYDTNLKKVVRGSRILFRSLDLLCNIAVVISVSIMLVLLRILNDITYNITDSDGDIIETRLFNKDINLTPSYLLLGISSASLVLSCIVMLGYLRSSKTAGKLSTFYTIIEIIIAIVVSVMFFYTASLFQIPMVRKLARNDLWAAACVPIRHPDPNKPIPDSLLEFLGHMCIAGDWSIVCGYISGTLQALLLISTTFTLTRYYIKRSSRSNNTEKP